jgi:hypothetical protein
MLRTFCFTVVALLIGVACGRSEAPKTTAAPPMAPPPVAAPGPSASAPFRVAAVSLGSAIAADKRVTTPAQTFAATDTIYASVHSEGTAPSVTLTARWSYEDGQLVNESSQTIAPTGTHVTEFHIAKPSGWPAGRYKLEIASNGAPVAAQEFEVR